MEWDLNDRNLSGVLSRWFYTELHCSREKKEKFKRETMISVNNVEFKVLMMMMIQRKNDFNRIISKWRAYPYTYYS